MTKRDEDRARRARCAECRAPIGPRPENRFFPFCSARCRQIDLSRWLGEEYRIAVSASATERRMPSGRPPDDDS